MFHPIVLLKLDFTAVSQFTKHQLTCIFIGLERTIDLLLHVVDCNLDHTVDCVSQSFPGNNFGKRVKEILW